jgi:hypothetical protein
MEEGAMKKMISRALGVAVGTAALAIATGQTAIAQQSQTPAPAGTPTTQTPAAQQTTPSGQQVTLSGCIEREADYRRAVGAGRGGAASTGAGVGNEFILTNALMTPASGAATAPRTGADVPTTTGTAGTAGNAYELTGTHESDAAAHVGKRVEITGTLKPANTAPGGPTASIPGSQDLKLREVEVASIREASGTCSESTPSGR